MKVEALPWVLEYMLGRIGIAVVVVGILAADILANQAAVRRDSSDHCRRANAVVNVVCRRQARRTASDGLAGIPVRPQSLPQQLPLYCLDHCSVFLFAYLCDRPCDLHLTSADLALAASSLEP